MKSVTKEFKMSKEDLAAMLEAMKPVPIMQIGSVNPYDVWEQNARNMWQSLGKKMGFDYETAKPVPGKGPAFCTAVRT